MNKRNILLFAIVLAVLAVMVFGVTFLVLRLRGSSRTTSANAVSTRPIVNSAADAVKIMGLGFINAGPPYDFRHPTSVSYVQTTFGQAQKLLGFNPFRRSAVTPDYPDGEPVWVFEAFGPFKPSRSRVLVDQTPQPVNTLWVVFVRGKPDAYLFDTSNERYNLGQLGSVVNVPLSQLTGR